MYKRLKISVVIPCRNEGNHLKKVIKKIPSFIDEVIIVSNCSTDNTVEVARNLGVTVYEDNRVKTGIGYGYAHMTGLSKAKGDVIIAMDGDGTYPIEGVSTIIDRLIDHNYDFISCNRYPTLPGTVIPLKLKLGVYLLNIETRLLYGKKIQDILSGMWVLRKGTRRKLNLTEGDWNLSPQIKLNAMLHSEIKFAEHKIVQHHREGETKQDYFTTGLSHALWLLKNRLRL